MTATVNLQMRSRIFRHSRWLGAVWILGPVAEDDERRGR
jgi:hypothetical protein